ncbi:MAG: hypothetical protein ACHQET_12010 [Chitinophagales bacterium]
MQNKNLIPILLLSVFSNYATAQRTDSTKNISHFFASAAATNNGISLIPAFSLGKPAAIFDLSMGKNKFSFDPEFTYSLEGKPWYFLFWFRYKFLTAEKFRLSAGTHLAINFKSAVLPSNMDSKEVSIAERYLAFEFSPNYFLTKNISIGIYYLFSHGLDPTTINNTHFLTINAAILNIKLIEKVFMNIIPQFDYLNQGKNDGFYFSSTFILARKNFPVSISSVINRVIQTSTAGNHAFVWNVTLTYSFGRGYFAL